MKAALLYGFGQALQVEEIPRPRVEKPFDIIVKLAGAGLCRTDLHTIEGQLVEAYGTPTFPYIVGHENAGWIEEVGSAVATLSKGDPVLLHPLVTCGLCRACRAGNDMHCRDSRLPGVDATNDGGFAEYVRSDIRAVVELPAGMDPSAIAGHADAGITAYHAVKKLIALTHPGATVAVVGIGGVGQYAVQLLKHLTAARVIAVDVEERRLDLARGLGADDVVLSGPDGGVADVVALTDDGGGVDVVLDLVGDGPVPQNAFLMLAKGGTYSIVGYGGEATLRTIDATVREINVLGNLVGTHNDLLELVEMERTGRLKTTHQSYVLDDVNQALDDLQQNAILGRAVIVPGN